MSFGICIGCIDGVPCSKKIHAFICGIYTLLYALFYMLLETGAWGNEWKTFSYKGYDLSLRDRCVSSFSTVAIFYGLQFWKTVKSDDLTTVCGRSAKATWGPSQILKLT